MSEWRPIETAKRDGTHVLLYTTSFNGEWLTIEGWYFSSPKEIDDGWETEFGFHGEPTHWMPLPSPPDAYEGKQAVAT